MTAEKCTKKRDAACKVVVLLIKPVAFVAFSLPLPSPWSDLEVPSSPDVTAAVVLLI